MPLIAQDLLLAAQYLSSIVYKLTCHHSPIGHIMNRYLGGKLGVKKIVWSLGISLIITPKMLSGHTVQMTLSLARLCVTETSDHGILPGME